MSVSDIRTVAAVAVAVVAVMYDVRTRRIPNVWTLGTAVCAIVFAALTGGPTTVLQSGAGWFVGALLFFPFFALGGMGAGDVKLMAALGAWLGPTESVWLALFASIAGGVFGVIVALAHGYLQTALTNLWLMMTHWRVAGLRPVPGVTLAQTTGPRLAYAIPIAIGVLCTIWRR